MGSSGAFKILEVLADKLENAIRTPSDTRGHATLLDGQQSSRVRIIAVRAL